MLPPAYAILVGSNLPGPGQQPLHFAVDDAHRVADVLVEIGDHAPERVRVLEDPSPAELLDALDVVRAAVAEHRANGERTSVTFYYSGHARARALNLGAEEVPIGTLRAALEAIDATFTLVVLDACQAGAPGTAKGVHVVPDFSTQSVAGLTTRGTVVMASSTADELSQESLILRGSTFTHHLVSGLRGAADLQGDGLVTLDEAYTYTYHRTLTATAASALGTQHPTLESTLTGYGATVLTRPAAASAQVVFPDPLVAEIVLEHLGTGTVVAEIHKAAGSEVRLALPPGEYQATLRPESGVPERCTLTLMPERSTVFETMDCAPQSAGSIVPKGSGRNLHRTTFEAGIGALYNGRPDAFLERLATFGYRDSRNQVHRTGATPFAQVTAGRSLTSHLSVVGTFGTLDARSYARDNLDGYGELESVSYTWTTRRITVSARATYTKGPWGAFVQAGAGPAWTTARYEEVPDSPLTGHLASAFGVTVMPGHRHHGVGLFAQADYIWAPTLKNLLDETHNTGGLSWQLGMRLVP